MYGRSRPAAADETIALAKGPRRRVGTCDNSAAAELKPNRQIAKPKFADVAQRLIGIIPVYEARAEVELNAQQRCG